MLHEGYKLLHQLSFQNGSSFDDGLVAFARYLTPQYYHRPLTDPIAVSGKYETGEVSAVLRFCDRKDTFIACYANDATTPNGGTHLDGLLIGVARALTRLGQQEGIINTTESELCRHDVLPGLTAIISVRLCSVQYGDNIRGKGANPEVGPQVLWLVERQLGSYFAARPEQARTVVRHCLMRRSSMDGILPRQGYHPM
jgi:DNA gyrase subunit B